MPTYAPQSPESVILELLLECYPAPMSIKELAGEHGDRTQTMDAVDNLLAAGLAHGAGELVWPTRSTWHCAVMLDHVDPRADRAA